MKITVVRGILCSILVHTAIVYPSEEVLLKSRRFVPEPGISTVAKEKIGVIPEKAHVLIQLKEIPTIKRRNELESKGIKLLSYVPNKTWFASIPSDKAGEIARVPGIVAISEILPEDKIATAIRQRGVRSHATNKDGSVNLVVLFYKDVSLDRAREVIVNVAGRVTGKKPLINALVVTVSSETVSVLANNDLVQWINEVAPPPKGRNDGSRAAISVNDVQGPPYNLTGEGVQIGQWDVGCVSDQHPDLVGRILQRDCVGLSDHATYVAGTMVGNGSLNWNYRGMAISSIVYSYYGDFDDLDVHYNEAINTFGIDISNNSWGPEGGRAPYSERMAEIDKIVRGEIGRPIPIIWAILNEGERGEWGWIGEAEGAKNVIAVGAINSNDDTRYSRSSLGPTPEPFGEPWVFEFGRLKPDVMAAGCESPERWYEPDRSIWSTIPDAWLNWWTREEIRGRIIEGLPPDGIDDFDYPYDGQCGTSAAAPAVSGSVALMLEDWRNTHGEPDPLPATIKAILIQTSTDLGDVGPDYSYGYGKINTKGAVDLIRYDVANNAIVEDSIIEQNDKDCFTIYVAGGVQRLKMTLVWDDYPGDPAAAKALVNDLDLIVKAPDETRYYPWTLDPTNPGNPATRNQADHLNNVEQVCVDNPISGTWTVEVHGTGVPEFDQTYSLVTDNLAFVEIPQETSAFRVKNDVGETVARFSSLGNLVLKGTLEENSNHLPDEYNDEFRFQDWAGNDVMIINTTDGNMYIDGQKHEKQNVLAPGDEDDFIVKNRNGDIVAYVNDSGNLYLKGKLYEHVDP